MANINTVQLGTWTSAGGAIKQSGELTGTGSAQNFAHGLGVTPSVVLAIPSELPADLTAGFDAAYGTHDATNAVVTVTNGCKYYMLCIV